MESTCVSRRKRLTSGVGSVVVVSVASVQLASDCVSHFEKETTASKLHSASEAAF